MEDIRLRPKEVIFMDKTMRIIAVIREMTEYINTCLKDIENTKMAIDWIKNGLDRYYEKGEKTLKGGSKIWLCDPDDDSNRFMYTLMPIFESDDDYETYYVNMLEKLPKRIDKLNKQIEDMIENLKIELNTYDEG